MPTYVTLYCIVQTSAWQKGQELLQRLGLIGMLVENSKMQFDLALLPSTSANYYRINVFVLWILFNRAQELANQLEPARTSNLTSNLTSDIENNIPSSKCEEATIDEIS